MRSMAINLVVALIWLLLQTHPSLLDFAFGLSLGFGLLFLFRPVLGSQDYVRRVLAAIAFAGIFMKEFLTSCWQMMWFAAFVPVDRLRPDFIIYDISGLTRLEAVLLMYGISLTPGNNAVDISKDFTRIYLHVLDCPDADAVRRSIDKTLKRGILAFTR